jgi:diadenosine tetraphosphate (Ap4A) HIT family hydrolase
VTGNGECDLCNSDGGEVLYRHVKLRVVAVEGEDAAVYRGFCRVIWNKHVKEMGDLDDGDKSLIMDAVFRVEAALRASLNPAKMNLASLGNMTPHVHWHVIPRFRDDATFPKPIWAALRQDGVPAVRDIDTLKSHDSVSAWKGAVREALHSL